MISHDIGIGGWIMKRRSVRISILLTLVFVVALLAIGCKGNRNRGETTKPPVETVESLAQTVDSPDETTESPVETKAPSGENTELPDETNELPGDTAETTTDPQPEPGNRVIYYEDFEGRGTLVGTSTVMRELGWRVDSTADGAYSNNTASFRFSKVNGNMMLLVNNNKADAKDSYIVILSEALMGAFHEHNYTYQYDVMYDGASNVKRYIALVSEYDGLYYNSFHLRNGGYANNQCHTYAASWITYDTKGDTYYAGYTDSGSIANRLLGVDYDDSVNAFCGISVSIRYVVDWENGNSVYMRVNDAGYPGSGVWTLVSKGRASSDYNPFAGGAAIALKVGGAQTGYIDNIIIWEGTGDEPSDKSSPLITSHTEGCSGHHFEGSGTCLDPKVCIYCGEIAQGNDAHVFVSIQGTQDAKCSVCHCYQSALASNWAIKETPVYAGGKVSSSTYRAGHGIEADFRYENDSLMLLISKTNEAEFRAYCALIESSGSKPVYTHAQDGNLYAQYPSGDAFIYLYYTASVGEVRIVYDPHSDCSPADFGYAREKQDGETTIVYQYGVPMNAAGVNISKNDEGKIDCGMMYVIKLADNSVIIIDGGGYQQFDTAQIDGFMKFLRNITGTREGEKVRIAAWFITHMHSDHAAGFCLFVKKYHESLDFDRIFFNLPSVNLEDSLMRATRSNYGKLLGYISSYMDDVTFIKIHTGQSFSLGEVKINVMYTHEDIVNAWKANTKIAGDFNNSSSVIKLEFDGKSFMVLGDINQPAMNIIIKNNAKETLKSDIVQLAHHVINDVSALYDVIQAPVALIPQSPKGCTRNETRLAAYQAAMRYVEDDMYFYASEETAGIAVVDGKIAKVYSEEVHGGAYSGWSW